MKQRNLLKTPIMCLLIILGCEKDSPIEVNPSISTSLSFIHFDKEDEIQTFYLSNSGNVSIEWVLEVTSEYLDIVDETGLLQPGDSTKIILNVNREVLINDIEYTEVNINTNKNIELIVPVEIFTQEMDRWPLTNDIIDAEYNRAKDVIVAVTYDTDELLIINPKNKTTSTINLGLTPRCISVSQDGNYAVVGHNGVVSYLDLQNLQVVRTVGLTFDTYDIVLAPNNWVYVFPAEGQWVEIYCINLNNSEESTSWRSVHERTVAKLHPSGKYIYGTRTSSIPSDFEKYAISNGTAVYLYDSRYHGDYSFGGDIWVSEDGYLLFGKSGNIFQSDENESEDIVYLGNLGNDYLIHALDYSQKSKRIYVVPESKYAYDPEPLEEVQFYNLEYVNIGSTSLPKVPIEQNGVFEFINSGGQYGFFNSNGDKFYVLTKTNSNSKINQWAIVTLEVE